MNNPKTIIALMALTIAGLSGLKAQTSKSGLVDDDNNTLLGQLKEEGSRPILTGVPILLIAPDSRAGAMGDVGVASKPDANSIHWNAAKLAFTENTTDITFTYSPWLHNLVPDISLAYLAGYYKINERSSIGASLTYFSIGDMNFVNEQNVLIGVYSPNEFAVDLAYAMKLTDNLSASVTGRYIRSDLTLGQTVDNTQTFAGQAGAADVGLYYENEIKSQKPSSYALGLQISNLGSKISYSNNNTKEFLPANLRIGGRYTMNFDQFNEISFMLDFNKLLVPTPALYEDDTIYAGMDGNVGTLQGAIQSFYDAPNGFKEELQEISISAGMEYWYRKMFAVRAGYFYENAHKGNRQYLTFGAGLKYNVLKLDISYLITTAQISYNPLKNTLRVSLSFEI
ncbi:MAG: type IX secretion system outer membrane channel protein PorV [Bacteroidales bacterium]|jgi:hypothetical protein|nr:type IX secretion system outer membrane channel protein PorV [Bacteroidales bacterium]